MPRGVGTSKEQVIEHELLLWPNRVQPAVVQPFSDKMLNEFCSAGNFLGPTQLVKGFEAEDHTVMAQATFDRMNSHRVNRLL